MFTLFITLASIGMLAFLLGCVAKIWKKKGTIHFSILFGVSQLLLIAWAWKLWPVAFSNLTSMLWYLGFVPLLVALELAKQKLKKQEGPFRTKA